MRRHAVPVLLAAALASGAPVATASALTAQAGSAQPGPGAPALVRLHGELAKTPQEPGERPHAAVRVGGRFVPVDADAVASVDPGRTVAIDVVVPDRVERAASVGSTLRVTEPGGGSATHTLDDADLAAAADGTAVAASTELGQATVDSATAPGATPLAVDAVTGTTATTTTAYTPATRKMLILNVAPAGITRSDASSTTLTSTISRSNTFWRANSRNELGVALDRVASGYTSAYTCDDPFGLWNEAADRTGYTGAANTTLALRLPKDAYDIGGCSWGLGTIGDNPNDSGAIYYVTDSSDTMSHEVGHNMSLNHANRLTCPTVSDATFTTSSSGRTWGSSCREIGYGDGRDVMGIDNTGTTSAMLSTPQAFATGMLEPAARVAAPAGQATTVTLRPLAGRTGVRVATTVDNATGVTYYVEYRTAASLDTYDAWGARPGVRVLRYMGHQDTSVLLDPSPTGQDQATDHDAVVDPGETLWSQSGRVEVTTVSADSTQAVVRISNDVSATPFTTTGTPSIGGTRAVGRTLTAYAGTWSPTPTTYAYQWKRNGVAISGANARTYTATRADAGRYLSVAVTARRPGTIAATRVSARVGIPIYATTRPWVEGTAKVGRTLTARVGSWTPTPSSYAYRWYRGSTAITGATSRTYVATSSDAGHRIRVKVIARRTGYSTGTAYSPYTAYVAR